jgi:hypothetical protein
MAVQMAVRKLSTHPLIEKKDGVKGYQINDVRSNVSQSVTNATEFSISTRDNAGFPA